MQMRIEKWETAVDIKGALDKLPKMATGGMILAVINDVLKNVQYAPTTGALTDEEWKSIADAGSDTIYRWPRMRQAINTVLSRRTVPPPAAEPSPAPVKLCRCGFPAHVGRCQPADPALVCSHKWVCRLDQQQCMEDCHGKHDLVCDLCGTSASPAPVDKPSPADAQGDLATPIGDSSFADKICEILYRRVGMGRLDNDPIAKEIIAVAQAHPPAGWVSVKAVREAINEEYPSPTLVDAICARLSPAKPTERVTVDSPLSEYLVAPEGEGWKWTATSTERTRERDYHCIEFVRQRAELKGAGE